MTSVVKTCVRCGNQFLTQAHNGKYCPACREITKRRAVNRTRYFTRCLRKIMQADCNTPVKNVLTPDEWERLDGYLNELKR